MVLSTFSHYLTFLDIQLSPLSTACGKFWRQESKQVATLHLLSGSRER